MIATVLCQATGLPSLMGRMVLINDEVCIEEEGLPSRRGRSKAPQLTTVLAWVLPSRKRKV